MANTDQTDEPLTPSQRLEAGIHQGRPPFGLMFDDDGETLVPGDRFDVAVRILKLRDAGHSSREITDRVDPSRSTVSRVANNREHYNDKIERIYL